MNDLYLQVPKNNFSVRNQIEELNREVKAHIAPSKIHGIGVFALRDIPRGEKLYLFPSSARRWYSIPYARFGEIEEPIRNVIFARWPSVINGSMFQSPSDDVWLASFINHSANPNYEQTTDSALRDIKRGEEIVEDYRVMQNYSFLYPWIDHPKAEGITGWLKRKLFTV